MIVGLLGGIMAAAITTIPSSSATFTATTSNGAETLGAGTVVLADDSVGTLYSTLTALKPGDTATSCIKVTYTGTIGATVKLYATLTSNTGFGSWVRFTVDQGTTGPASSRTCATAPAFGGTITNLTTNTAASSLPTTAGTGYTCWTAATGDSRWYRITYTIDSATPDAQQGKSVDIAFTWFAQNT